MMDKYGSVLLCYFFFFFASEFPFFQKKVVERHKVGEKRLEGSVPECICVRLRIRWGGRGRKRNKLGEHTSLKGRVGLMP